MDKILKDIHWLFWGFALVSLVYGIYGRINMSQSTLDFIIHDTYFIISSVHVLTFQSVLLFIVGFIYYIFYNSSRFKPVPILSVVHALLTLVGLSLLFFIPMIKNRLSLVNMNEIVLVSAFGVLLTQILFLVNLFIAVLRKKSTP